MVGPRLLRADFKPFFIIIIICGAWIKCGGSSSSRRRRRRRRGLLVLAPYTAAARTSEPSEPDSQPLNAVCLCILTYLLAS